MIPEQIKYDPATGKPIHEDYYTQPGNKLDLLYSSFLDLLSLINNNWSKDKLYLNNSPIQNDRKAMALQDIRFKNLKNRKYNWGNNVNSFWLKRNEEVLNSLSDEDRMRIAGEDGIIDYNEALNWQQSIGAGNDGKFGSNVGNIVNKKFGVNLGNFVNPANRTQAKEQSLDNTASQLNTQETKKRWWDNFNQTNDTLVWNWRPRHLLPRTSTVNGENYEVRVDNNDLSWFIDMKNGKMKKVKEGLFGDPTISQGKDFENTGWIDILPEHGVFRKHGGHITKHQQGGTMNEQEQIIRQVIQGINQGDPQIMQALSSLDLQQQQAILQSIAQLAQQGDLEAANAINKIQNPQTAKLGTKLSYIKRLKGVCPEGTEKIYLKSGGCMCLKVAKAQEGTKTDKSTIEQWKKDRKKYKNDEAAKDSVAINKFNDQETIVNKGSKGTYKNGVWIPDRSKYKKVENKADSSKTKK